MISKNGIHIGRPFYYDPNKDGEVDRFIADCQAYFDSCWEEEYVKDANGDQIYDDDGQPVKEYRQTKPYLISGLALHLGFDMETLSNYGKRDEFEKIVKQCKLVVRHGLECKSIQDHRATAGCIFNLKANHGMSDRLEITSTNTNVNVENDPSNLSKEETDCLKAASEAAARQFRQSNEDP